MLYARFHGKQLCAYTTLVSLVQKLLQKPLSHEKPKSKKRHQKLFTE